MTSDFKKRHGIRHWLVVVGIRLIKFLVAVILGVYLFSFGFSLSKITLATFFSKELLDQTSNYFVSIPYFIKAKNLSIDRLSLNIAGVGTWWTMVVGVPLMLMGVTYLFANFILLLQGVFDYVYNFSHCPWYKWHKITVEMAKHGKRYIRKSQEDLDYQGAKKTRDV